MFEVEIYEDSNGRSEIGELLEELNRRAHTSKHSRVRLKKLAEYIELLKAYGTQIGVPVVKHIANTRLWELRPTSDRIFFAYWKDNRFVLLTHFVKKTQRTPAREIQRAQRSLDDFLKGDG